MNTRHVLINAVLFQLLWFAAVLLGWPAALAVLVVLVMHLYLAPGPAVPWQKLLVLAGLGMVFDGMMTRGGIYLFDDTTMVALGTLPLWLACLWLGFVMTLVASLDWLRRNALWFTLASALAGPTSYWAGSRLGALSLETEMLWLTALFWGGFAFLASHLLNTGSAKTITV